MSNVWRGKLLVQRIRDINDTRWSDGTYGPPTPEIECLLKRAINHVNGERPDLAERSCLLIEYLIVRHRRALA